LFKDRIKNYLLKSLQFGFSMSEQIDLPRSVFILPLNKFTLTDIWFLRKKNFVQRRINPVTWLCLSQAMTLISDVIRVQWRREAIVCFVDIGGIRDHHCLKFLVIMTDHYPWFWSRHLNKKSGGVKLVLWTQTSHLNGHYKKKQRLWISDWTC
jgi:hypothetical protein